MFCNGSLAGGYKMRTSDSASECTAGSVVEVEVVFDVWGLKKERKACLKRVSLPIGNLTCEL